MGSYLGRRLFRRLSGNGNCGHEYGTDPSAEDQSALLEYLKQL